MLHFIPFYYVLKLAFLIWLFHPKTVGASWVYDNYLQAWAESITQFEKEAADAINKGKEAVGLKGKEKKAE